MVGYKNILYLLLYKSLYCATRDGSLHFLIPMKRGWDSAGYQRTNVLSESTALTLVQSDGFKELKMMREKANKLR